MRIFFAVLLAAGLVAGCSGSRQLAQRQMQIIDSLQAENQLLRLRRGVLQDSLQFYDDIRSGQYDRDMRVLRDRLSRMQFDLAALRDGGRSVAVLPADDLFRPASDSLTEQGAVQLDSLAAQIEAVYPARALRVEGHSDSAPLNAALQQAYGSNWGLSAARAAAVVRYLVSEGRLAAGRFTLVAFGDTQPMADNDTPTGRRQNRRVRVAVLPEPRDYARPADASF